MFASVSFPPPNDLSSISFLPQSVSFLEGDFNWLDETKSPDLPPRVLASAPPSLDTRGKRKGSPTDYTNKDLLRFREEIFYLYQDSPKRPKFVTSKTLINNIGASTANMGTDTGTDMSTDRNIQQKRTFVCVSPRTNVVSRENICGKTYTFSDHDGVFISTKYSVGETESYDTCGSWNVCQISPSTPDSLLQLFVLDIITGDFQFDSIVSYITEKTKTFCEH